MDWREINMLNRHRRLDRGPRIITWTLIAMLAAALAAPFVTMAIDALIIRQQLSNDR